MYASLFNLHVATGGHHSNGPYVPTNQPRGRDTQTSVDAHMDTQTWWLLFMEVLLKTRQKYFCFCHKGTQALVECAQLCGYVSWRRRKALLKPSLIDFICRIDSKKSAPFQGPNSIGSGSNERYRIH